MLNQQVTTYDLCEVLYCTCSIPIKKYKRKLHLFVNETINKLRASRHPAVLAVTLFSARRKHADRKYS